MINVEKEKIEGRKPCEINASNKRKRTQTFARDCTQAIQRSLTKLRKKGS